MKARSTARPIVDRPLISGEPVQVGLISVPSLIGGDAYRETPYNGILLAAYDPARTTEALVCEDLRRRFGDDVEIAVAHIPAVTA